MTSPRGRGRWGTSNCRGRHRIPTAAGTSAAIDLIRAYGADCATTCIATTRYRIRAYDTTISVPRFNNSDTQATVLLVQNTRATPHTSTV